MTISIPSLYAITSSIQPSVFFIEECNYNDSKNKQPSYIKKEMIRGNISTINASSKEIENPNIQRIERAYINKENDSIVVSGHVKFLANSLEPLNCNSKDFVDAHKNFINKSKEENYFEILATKYLINIINGRWLWRNFAISNNIKITIKTNKNNLNLTFDPLSLSTVFSMDIKEFLNIENFIEIRNEITKSLQEKNNLLILDIVAICQIGEGAYYFPSEEFSDEKNKDSSKILFGILDKTNNKQAGIHSQKIGNAIRTIDCWYSEFKNNKVVLPIEPYGQQQSISKAWRNSTNKEDLYSILSRINNNKYTIQVK